MSQIQELKDALEKLHGVRATHKESVPVKEVWKGKTVWEGVVEVFHIEGHSKTNQAYAWLHDSGNGVFPVTVLHIHPALTPLAAVQAFILQELGNAPIEA